MAKVNIPSGVTKKIRKDIKARATKALKSPKFEDVMRKAVVDDHILKGKSPVRGKGRFPKYSDSYKKQIRRNLKAFGKKVRPVNLKLSGQMLSTFFVKVTGLKMNIGFTDELAEYHNTGNDKLPRRAILPTKSNEVFNNNIRKSIRKFLEKVFR